MGILSIFFFCIVISSASGTFPGTQNVLNKINKILFKRNHTKGPKMLTEALYPHEELIYQRVSLGVPLPLWTCVFFSLGQWISIERKPRTSA